MAASASRTEATGASTGAVRAGPGRQGLWRDEEWEEPADKEEPGERAQRMKGTEFRPVQGD